MIHRKISHSYVDFTNWNDDIDTRVFDILQLVNKMSKLWLFGLPLDNKKTRALAVWPPLSDITCDYF